MLNGTDVTGRNKRDQDRAFSEHSTDPNKAPSTAAVRLLYLGIGYAGLVLAVLGVALPLIPTVPFLLIAAWAFARSDPQLLERIHRHRHFGPLLRTWQTERAIPTRAKVAAMLMMTGSWALVAVTVSDPLLPMMLGALLGAVALYIFTRPAPEASTATLDRSCLLPCGRPLQ
jgi:uncharacterized membrane protein YbaN (DUF454 family)